MQKLYDVRLATTDDYSSLKKLWHVCFGDSEEVIENFFRNTATPQNIIGAFQGEKALGALYIVDCDAYIQGDIYTASYIYAVSTLPEFRNQGIMKALFNFLYEVSSQRGTDILFLVPADEGLFNMYGKLGFQTGLYYKNRIKYKTEETSFTLSDLSYDEYKSYRKQVLYNHIDLKEKAFSSFLKPVGDDIKTICVKDDGYCVYEKDDDNLIIHDLFGNEEKVLSAVFVKENCESVVIRDVRNGDIPFGMYRLLKDITISENIFFGIPYGG